MTTITYRCGRKIAMALAAAFVSACSTPPTEPKQPDPARIALERALGRSSAMPAHADHADVAPKPARMSGEAITIRSYVGDAANLLSRVAKARNLEFKVTGPEPRLPLLVAVDVDAVSFEDFLKDVGYQFGQRANVVLGDRHIEIRYRGQP